MDISGWKKKTLLHKIITVIGGLASIVVIISGVLDLTNVYNNTLITPCMGIVLLTLAAERWASERIWACIFLAMGIFALFTSWLR